MSWFWLARPKLLPFVLLLVALGFGWGHWDYGLWGRNFGALAVVLVAWTLLHAGTLWMNAALDHDEGEVLLGRSVPVPAGAFAVGLAAVTLCAALCAWVGPLVGLCGLVCAVLAVLYSHPATAWKGHPVGGPVVNAVGYGLLSPLAGWAVVEVPWTPRGAAAWIAVAAGVTGAYFAAQAFQAGEDADRGYRTLVATHGPVACVRVARLLIGAAFAVAVVMALGGWLPRALVGVALGGLWVDRWFSEWADQGGLGGEVAARTMAGRLLWAALLALGLAYGDYLLQLGQRLPVAGLGTARGVPPWEDLARVHGVAEAPSAR